MNEEQKHEYHEKYKIKKQKGEKFWPDEIYKDLLISFAIFILLVGLAAFIGVANEPKADPSDSSYIPRPEWYFLFLFKFLAIYGTIPVLGKIEWIATALVPGIGVGLLFLLPFIDRSPVRYYSKRVAAISVMGVIVTTIVGLTLIADIPTSIGEGKPYLAGMLQPVAGLILPALAIGVIFLAAYFFKGSANRVMIWSTSLFSILIMATSVAILLNAPPKEAAPETQLATTLPEQILAGQDLYSVQCVECHGAEGEGGEIKGVQGLEGKILPPLKSADIMYTFTDETIKNIISYGQPDQGMPPFAKQYGGELGPGEVEYIVAFMRYTWDDRSQLPAEVVKANAVPKLGPNEVPSYDVHVAPLIKRYCQSCHRTGKKNNNYIMDTYNNVLHSGDNKDKNIIPGDIVNSHLIQLINRQDLGKEQGGPMPPTKALKPEIIDIFTRWIAGGAPQTAADAAKVTLPAASPAATPTAAP